MLPFILHRSNESKATGYLQILVYGISLIQRLKPIYTLRKRYTVMHSKLGISQCIVHTAYRNSLRSSSTRKPNYPEHYFYFLFYRYRFSNFSVKNHIFRFFSVAHKSNVLKFYRIKFLMILPQVHLRKPCYDLSFL